MLLVDQPGIFIPMRFTPDKIDVKQGDTVKIMLKNMGMQMH